MKLHTLFAALLVLVAVGCDRTNEAPPAPVDSGRYTYLLAEAIAEGVVRFNPEGTGYSSGVDTITAELINATDRELDIQVPAGQVLFSGVGGQQDMVLGGLVTWVDPSSGESMWGNVVTLPPLAQLSLGLEAYCLDFELDNPQPGTSFEVAARSEAVAFLIERGHEAEVSPGAIQAAIWMAKDKVPIEEIRESIGLEEEEVNEAFRLLEENSAEVFQRLKEDRKRGVLRN